jgi:hypothetical protein
MIYKRKKEACPTNHDTTKDLLDILILEMETNHEVSEHDLIATLRSVSKNKIQVTED